MYSTLNAHQRNKRGTLVDKGANGGIVGCNNCIINTHPTRKFDIQGIDNHHLPGIPIVTAGAVVKNQCSAVTIVIIQYAIVRTGKTIHSSGQLEAFGNNVDGKSVKTGSYQRLITPDRYIIPLQVRNGLVYIDTLSYTDIDKNNLPMFF